MGVPDFERAEAILNSFQLPQGIIRHSRGVARVAAEAARLVQAAGVPVDEQLVEVAALLHDVDKPDTRGSLRHGVAAAARLVELGHEELAVPIASHPVTALLDEERFPRGWPSVILSVADRHVAQEFMTTDERIDDMQQRHPQFREELELSRRRAHALEADLAEVAGLSVEQLVDRLRAAWLAGEEA
ncbi:MAG TPA: HD domain-containing protein [Candidatus Limnocylindrales bacterium]|nr:HD domain-containing protein [Candidatus Limnocylindrales bacterium]